MDRSELGELLNMTEELVAPGRPNRPGTKISPAFITIHNTSNANAGADAKAHSRFIRNTGHYMIGNKKNWVSWHYTVDDQRVIKQLPANERAFHAGPANSVSIGIEVCMHRGIDQAAANRRAAHLVAALLFDFGLGVDRLRTHKAWTGKGCPALLLPNWQQFVQQVAQIRQSITSAGLVEPPAPLDPEEAEAIANTAGVEYDEADIDHDALSAMVEPTPEDE